MSDNQCSRLLDALKEGPVDPLQAWAKLGIYRLGARVFDLKQRGHNIVKATVAVKNRFGETCRVAQYRLEQQQ